MNDETLTRLLRTVDDAGPEPADVKEALRADLHSVLSRPTVERRAGTPTGSDERVDREAALRPVRRPRPRAGYGRSSRRRGDRRPTRLIAAAAAVGLIVSVGAGVEWATRADRDPDSPVVPSKVSEPTPATSPTPSVEAACGDYAATAPAFAVLEGFSDPGSAAAPATPDRPNSTSGTATDRPDLAAAASALEELERTLSTHALIDVPASRSLRLAAGGMHQAAAEVAAGNVSGARSSVQFALSYLRDISDAPDPAELPGCGFP